MLRILTTTFFVFGLLPRAAFSFPEMVRYGYVNCTSCHISVNGGGILNDYGREIAREKLSMFSIKEESKEAHFAYGAISETSVAQFLKGGGDVRTVYYYINDDTRKDAQTIFMQGDLELAAIKDRVAVVGTLGVEQPVPGRNVDFISRRHFASYSLTDEVAVRGGKFIPSYGINTADHVTFTRNPLGLGANYETYNLEGSYIGEHWHFFATGIFGAFDSRQPSRDRGGAIQAAFAPTEKIKVGLNAWYGKRPSQSRLLYGPFAMIGITNALTFQSEIDFQNVKPTRVGSSDFSGVATTQKLSYELKDGLWIYGIQEYGKVNYDLDATKAENYGVGVQIFPRPHFEFNIAYQRMRRLGVSPNFFDYAFLMSHFYL